MPKDQTLEDAKHLLIRIQNYWAERGYDVQGSIQNAGYSDRLRSTVFEVRTDLVAGRPQRKAKLA